MHILYDYLKKYWKLCGLVVILAAVNQVFSLFEPMIFQRIIDRYALRFHELTTQAPAEVWIALAEKARKPKLDYPRLRVARFSGPALTEGIETHRLEGVEVRVYSAAKTVADCFKYRNKVGLDVALEALREGWRARRFTMEEIFRFARICRVEKVMRPYLEGLVG